MSFMLRRFRHSVGRSRADARQDTPGVAANGSRGEPAGAGGIRRPEHMTDEDLRAVAGRAAASGSFSDGLPIRMALD
jgi:hypothetical protein